jgi:hypothetical protein
MAAKSVKRWLAPPRWTGRVTDRLEKAAPGIEGISEDGIVRLQAMLDRRARAGKADSWRSVNLTEILANRMDLIGRHSDALPLRETVLARRAEHLGVEHRLTKGAQWKLTRTERYIQESKTDDAAE